MAFVWKESSSIWKGEGIYHLTFAVTDRLPLLGTLQPLSAAGAQSLGAAGAQSLGTAGAQSLGATGAQPLGTAGAQLLGTAGCSTAPSRPYSGDVQRPDTTDGKNTNVADGNPPPATGGPLPPTNPKFTTHLAWVELTPLGLEVSRQLQHIGETVPGLALCAKQIMPDHIHVVLWVKKDSGRSIRQIGNGFRIGIKRAAIELGVWSADKAHVLGIPFIRTLSHAGQLRQMIDYVHANPDNAWERHLNPQFYTIRRNIARAGLLFDAMGKTRLLDYPDRNVVALSRSLTPEQIDAEVAKALSKAALGCVTYTAAINEAEKAVCKAIRQAGFPLVVLLLDGFPAPGTEAERYYHPSGVYHTACGEGKLLLLAPQPDNYSNASLISRTEEELIRKTQQKGQIYHPLPHTAKRWLMVAGNCMLRMIEAEGYPNLE